MLLLASSLIVAGASLVSARVCKVIPGDAAWPSDASWAELNKAVDGRLIKTVPLGQPCYQFGFDSPQCATVQANWHDTAYHEASSSSIMSAPFTNRSCDPFTGLYGCTNRDYVEYAVNVAKPDHIATAIQFAKKQNIRFVVKNTGHDYMGKSTGHGALSVWMHNMNSTEWIPSYKSAAYNGPAVKASSGVTMKQMYQEASAHGYIVLGGDCPTVGMTGGFIQGGGLGPLSGIAGLAADNTLEFEVVTMDGQFITASPTQNSDLFWALSGGGGGTYAVVWSVTVKVRPDFKWSGANLQFAAGDGVTLDQYWAGVNAYRAWTKNLTAINGYSFTNFISGFFSLQPAMVPNVTLAQFTALYNPLLKQLDTIGIKYNSSTGEFPGFFQAYDGLFPKSGGTFDVQNALGGAVLMPKSAFASPATLQPLNDLIRKILDDGAGGSEISITPSAAAANSATLPQWRTSQGQISVFIGWNNTGTYEQAQQQQAKVTTGYIPALKKVLPGSGAYLNEADAFDPDWKQDFYGVNYNKLLSIKQKWDPQGLLYGSTAVGGDLWQQQPDGRLCSV